MHIIFDKKSPNFAIDEKNRTISHIILHYTQMESDAALERLCSEEAGVSSHYFIHKNGDIYNLVEDKYIAWHAGVSYWKGLDKLNNHSIGIEIDNLGNEKFTDIQIDSVINLCKMLQSKYNIPSENIIGHSDIAPDRKLDPGIFFPWDLLLKNGLGIDILPSQLDAIAKSIEHTAKQSTYNYGSLRFTCDENKETIQKIQQAIRN
ncbi:MAG UNVERIFIED_CONTAM: N-acetylmuramoyl-L-alanine amidase [Rickettsiaceae bacterium]|jgi:N-acetylmuramoyl-L-alanine amidase